MCGPSGQEEAIAGQEQSFASMLQSNYSQYFGAQSQVLQNLNNMLTPIAEAGPNQQGFAGPELAALETQANQGVGQNYDQATRALNNKLAAQGGGNAYLPSGATAALQGRLSQAAADQQSSENLAITNANYTTGRQNWQNAVTGLNALSQDYNPNALAEQASGANKSAFEQANQIQDMRNQKESEIAGGVMSLATGLAGGVAGGIGNLDTAGTSTAGEQGLNFLGGFLGGIGGGGQ